MKKVRLLTGLAFLISWSQGLAQELVIAHARIIDGAGQTIEGGSIVVTDGRISSVSVDTVDAGDASVIDAQGMTVLPGLIDVHRHDLLGSLRGFAELASDAEVAEAVEHKAPASMQAGVVVAFGTDSPDLIRPMVEIDELSRVLSPDQVIATLTRNAAIFLEREYEIGTIEPGKVADLVIVDGNPIADIHDLARVRIVIQEGVVTVDNRP